MVTNSTGVTVKCNRDGCGNRHTLEPEEYEVRGDFICTTIYKGRCPTCRKRFDDMIAEVKAVEDRQIRLDRRREKVESLVRDYAAPPGMVAAILDLINDEAGTDIARGGGTLP
jgi:hypothetical protein